MHMAKVTWNFTLQSTPRENAKLKCSNISTLKNHEIKMLLKYSVFQYLIVTCWQYVGVSIGHLLLRMCQWPTASWPMGE